MGKLTRIFVFARLHTLNVILSRSWTASPVTEKEIFEHFCDINHGQYKNCILFFFNMKFCFQKDSS